MKIGDKVKVTVSGKGFGKGSIGKEYTILKIVPNGYCGETGVLLKGYKNSVQEGRVGISCLEVVKASEPQYEIY